MCWFCPVINCPVMNCVRSAYQAGFPWMTVPSSRLAVPCLYGDQRVGPCPCSLRNAPPKGKYSPRGFLVFCLLLWPASAVLAAIRCWQEISHVLFSADTYKVLHSLHKWNSCLMMGKVVNLVLKKVSMGNLIALSAKLSFELRNARTSAVDSTEIWSSGLITGRFSL